MPHSDDDICGQNSGEQFAPTAADAKSNGGAIRFRDRFNRVNSVFQSTLAKSQAFHTYDFTPSTTTVTPVTTGAEQLDFDLNEQISVVEKKEHAAPVWLRTVSGYSWRLIIFAIAVAIVVYGLSRIRMVLISVFIALVLNADLRPLRKMFDRHMKRGLAVLCTILTALLFVAAVVAFIVLSVVDSWSHVATETANGVQRLFALLEGPPFHIHLPWQGVSDALAAAQDWITTHYGQLLSDVVANVGRITELIVYAALALFLTIWFLSSGRKMWEWVLAQLPPSVRAGWTKAFGAGFTTFSDYSRGSVLIALCDGILAAILLFALRIPLAAPLAVLVFIGAFIPLVGAPVAMVIAGVVALATRGPIIALFVILGVALIGQLEGHILQPFIMGKQVKLHPVIVALSVTVGAILAGIVGAILAVPLVAVGWSIFRALRPPPVPGHPGSGQPQPGAVLELPVEIGGGQLVRDN